MTIIALSIAPGALQKSALTRSAPCRNPASARVLRPEHQTSVNAVTDVRLAKGRHACRASSLFHCIDRVGELP